MHVSNIFIQFLSSVLTLCYHEMSAFACKKLGFIVQYWKITKTWVKFAGHCLCVPEHSFSLQNFTFQCFALSKEIHGWPPWPLTTAFMIFYQLYVKRSILWDIDYILSQLIVSDCLWCNKCFSGTNLQLFLILLIIQVDFHKEIYKYILRNENENFLTHHTVNCHCWRCFQFSNKGQFIQVFLWS